MRTREEKVLFDGDHVRLDGVVHQCDLTADHIGRTSCRLYVKIHDDGPVSFTHGERVSDETPISCVVCMGMEGRW